MRVARGARAGCGLAARAGGVAAGVRTRLAGGRGADVPRRGVAAHPDAATRDALIRDKIVAGNWQQHLGASPSLFVNAATWGCCSPASSSPRTATPASGNPQAHARPRRRAADPQGRGHGDAHDGRAVRHRRDDRRRRCSPTRAARGRRLSLLVRHARRGGAHRRRRGALPRAYEQAIHAIGKAAAGDGPIDGPGISIKLSALHPRYSRAAQVAA